MLNIYHNGSIFTAPVIDRVIWQTDIKSYPGKLKFKALVNSINDISNGDKVTFVFNGEKIFCGYIFSYSFDKENIAEITAYDQIRYLKNSDTKKFENITANGIFSSICSEFGLKTGSVDNTGYVIESLTRSNSSLLDIIQYSLAITKENTGKDFIIYDDFGSLCLKNTDSRLLPIMVSRSSSENFYSSKDIDGASFNQVKLIKDNSKRGRREITLIKDNASIQKWGILQYLGKLQKYENGNQKAQKILQKKNREREKFSIDNAIGNPKVRAGTKIYTDIRGKTEIITVKKAVHRFEEGHHFMTLDALI